MEWVVGQWVEWSGRAWKVIEPHRDGVSLEFQDGTGALQWVGEYCTEQPKPFAWQVGKTYRTTLEGVTAIVVSASPVSFGVQMSDKPGTVCVDRQTGQIIGMESRSDQPHLLPFLADEPSEPEATLTERYTLEHDGEPWWMLRDNQRGQVLPFATRELAEHALALAKSGEGLLGWKAEEVQEWDEPAPSTQIKSRYHRTIKGVTIDLYDIAAAYGVTGHAEFHAMKKLIMAGNRGYKDRDQDLAEAIVSIKRARELAKGGGQ